MIVILVGYAAFVLPTVGRQGVNWDEQTDLDIAAVYAESNYGLVYGSADDLINTRLPMFSAGLLFRVLDGDRLLLARVLSILAAATTLVAVYLFGRLELDRAKGLVAAAILGTSPYFLFFGKQALTEGDVWITSALAWLLVAAAYYRAAPTLGRAAWVGIALGLALSAKISAVALIPPVAILLLIGRHRAQQLGGIPPPVQRLVGESALLLLLVAFTVWMSSNVVASLGVFSKFGLSISLQQSLPLVRFGAGVLIAALFGRWVVLHRSTLPAGFWMLVTVLLTATLTFFLVPPVHTTNPRILAALGNQFFQSGSGFDIGFLVEAALFHIEVVTLKSSVVLGIGLITALIVAIKRIRDRPCFLFPLLCVGSYAAFVVLLPWAQTRYLMPLFPLLAIFAADCLVDLYRRRRKLAVGGLSVALVVLAADIWMCYPDLNLNGYQWVGERYLTGRSTVGYRSLVHTPSDGIGECLSYVSEHAAAEDTLFTMFGEVHITRAVLPEPHFEIVNPLHQPASLDQADWVITSINFDIITRQAENRRSESIFAYPYYDRLELEREFTKAHSVRRAFDLEVAAVWRRSEMNVSGSAQWSGSQ